MVKDKTTHSLPNTPVVPTSSVRGLRPFCFVLFSLGGLNIIAALRAMRLGGSSEYQAVSYPVWLFIIFCFGWGVAFVWNGARLWRRRNGSPRLVLLTVGAYGLFLIVWWRLFARSDYAMMRWPFAVLIVVCLVGLTTWVGRRFRL